MNAVTQGTAIEWTHHPGFKGETWNPVTGCDRISPGCANCYARTMAKRLKAMGQPHYQVDGDGPGFGVTTHVETVNAPLGWMKPRCVFVNSMSDLFHESVSPEFVWACLDVMRLTPRHRYLVLTKRPEIMAAVVADYYRLAARGDVEYPLRNVWLGVSIENSRFTWRADVLREIPAAVRFISAEPLLGSLYPSEGTWSSLATGNPSPLSRRSSTRPTTPSNSSSSARSMEHSQQSTSRASPLTSSTDGCKSSDSNSANQPSSSRAPLDLTGIDWVIVGGESGPGARPFHVEHAREILRAAIALCDSCSRAWSDGLTVTPPACTGRPALFVKQLGARPMMPLLAPAASAFREQAFRLRDSKGGDPSEWPDDLRIREFPRSTA